MKVGDLVIALEDERREIQCIGIILEVKEDIREAKVLWSSESNPTGWWFWRALKTIG